jgi:hypothetical protein
VPLSSRPNATLAERLNTHPGGGHTFCQVREVERSNTERGMALCVMLDGALDRLKRMLRGIRFDRLPSWHVF